MIPQREFIMLLTFLSVGKLMCLYRTARQKHESALDTYLPTLQVFPGVSKFFIKSPGLPVRASNREVKKENKTRSGFSALIWAELKWKT